LKNFYAILSSKFTTRQFLGGKLEIQVEELGIRKWFPSRYFS